MRMKEWQILQKLITCIFPAGGETTKKILMVALRKSSCFNPSLPFTLLHLPLAKLILGLRFLSLSFLSLFRTPLETCSFDLVAVAFALATFLTETLLDLSLKLRALNKSVFVVLVFSRPIDFCLTSSCFCLSPFLPSFSQLFSRFRIEWVREFFRAIGRFLDWVPDVDWLSEEPEAWRWTFLRIEPTNFRHSWLPSGASFGSSMLTFWRAIFVDFGENMFTMLNSVCGVRMQKPLTTFVVPRWMSDRFALFAL